MEIPLAWIIHRGKEEKNNMGSRLDISYKLSIIWPMVRPQRVEYEGAYYHVMNRGQGRQNVYLESAITSIF